METMRYKRWVLQFDQDATCRVYASISDAEYTSVKTCVICRNFAAARDLAYPSEVRELFERLGVDYRKVAEMYELTWGRTEFYEYGGFFHFVGHIESGAEVTGLDAGYIKEPIGDRFMIGFSQRVAVVDPAFGDLPLVQLEFRTTLPWVLDELPDEE
jgi:hypothetical protein